MGQSFLTIFCKWSPNNSGRLSRRRILAPPIATFTPSAQAFIHVPWLNYRRRRAMTEAYFTAAVLLVDPAEEQPDLTKALVRYFVLELGFHFDGTPLTVLCEWGRDGTHINLGPGPAADLESLCVRCVGWSYSTRLNRHT